MQLDFSVLNKARQKQQGRDGTPGTASVHADFPRPELGAVGRDMLGQPEATAADGLSHLSHLHKNKTGHGKASFSAVVPLVPLVPSQKRKEQAGDEVERVLRQFQFAGGRERLNNMIYEFMSADRLDYDQALKIASDVVRTCGVAPCEASYEDVQELWQQMNGVVGRRNPKSQQPHPDDNRGHLQG